MGSEAEVLGLTRGTVRLIPHRESWEENARETIRMLRAVWGDDVTDIQHVGSTAIRGIAAKPIIDLAAAAPDLAALDRHREALAACGVAERGEDHPGQRLFVMGDFARDTRTHHIHVVRTGSTDWENYLNFRDYLNADAAAARRYAERKEQLARQFPQDRAAYTRGKAELVAVLLREAARWRRNTGHGKGNLLRW